MERQREENKIDARGVVRRDVDESGRAGAGNSDSDLARLKLNVMGFGFLDDETAQVVFGRRRREADPGGDFSRDVAQILLQFQVSNVRGRDLPARVDSEEQNGQAEDQFEFAHSENSLCRDECSLQ